MIGKAGIGLIAADFRIRIVQSQVGDVAKQVTLAILRNGLAEMLPQAPVSDGRLSVGIAAGSLGATAESLARGMPTLRATGGSSAGFGAGFLEPGHDGRDIYFIRLRGRSLTPAAHALVELMLDELHRLPGDGSVSVSRRSAALLKTVR